MISTSPDGPNSRNHNPSVKWWIHVNEEFTSLPVQSAMTLSRGDGARQLNNQYIRINVVTHTSRFKSYFIQAGPIYFTRSIHANHSTDPSPSGRRYFIVYWRVSRDDVAWVRPPNTTRNACALKGPVAKSRWCRHPWLIETVEFGFSLRIWNGRILRIRHLDHNNMLKSLYP